MPATDALSQPPQMKSNAAVADWQQNDGVPPLPLFVAAAVDAVHFAAAVVCVAGAAVAAAE